MSTSVRLPLRLEQALAQYCVEHRRTKSEVIVELLERHLARDSGARSAYELACEAGFIGAIDEEPEPASSRKVKALIARKHHRAPE